MIKTKSIGAAVSEEQKRKVMKLISDGFTPEGMKAIIETNAATFPSGKEYNTPLWEFFSLINTPVNL